MGMFFGRFFLDKEKDIIVELDQTGERMTYLLRTPNHRTGNLITNLARLCGLPLSEDEQGGLSEGLVFDEAGRLRPVGFFDPYFLPQDQIYDYDGTVKPAYEEQLQSDYFDYASFVNVSREGDYTEILDSGVYRLNFTNASGNPRGWYYVKESDGLTTRSGKGVGLVTVDKPM